MHIKRRKYFFIIKNKTNKNKKINEALPICHPCCTRLINSCFSGTRTMLPARWYLQSILEVRLEQRPMLSNLLFWCTGYWWANCHYWSKDVLRFHLCRQWHMDLWSSNILLLEYLRVPLYLCWRIISCYISGCHCKCHVHVAMISSDLFIDFWSICIWFMTDWLYHQKLIVIKPFTLTKSHMEKFLLFLIFLCLLYF